jgi:hypothetical protein
MLAITRRPGLPSRAARPRTFTIERARTHRARTHDGQPVLVTFLVMQPTENCRACTTVGAADLLDRAERGAYLRGRRLGIE